MVFTEKCKFFFGFSTYLSIITLLDECYFHIYFSHLSVCSIMYMRATLKVHSPEFSSSSQWLDMTDLTLLLFLPCVPQLDSHHCMLFKWNGDLPVVSHCNFEVLFYLICIVYGKDFEGNKVIISEWDASSVFYCCLSHSHVQ